VAAATEQVAAEAAGSLEAVAETIGLHAAGAAWVVRPAALNGRLGECSAAAAGWSRMARLPCWYAGARWASQAVHFPDWGCSWSF
jgi:hypothetical protein